YVYRPHGVVRPERSVSEDADNSCPVCGSANPREATSCGSCGYSFSDASRTDKVDALLDDLMDLSKAPPEITEPDPPVEESPDVDETVAEKLFDCLRRHDRGPHPLPLVEQRGRARRPPREARPSPGGPGALRAGDPHGPSALVRVDVPRRRDEVPRAGRRSFAVP